MLKFILNAKPLETELNPAEVALDFVRKNKGLKGTKEGCREGDCGACSVLVGTLTDSGMSYQVQASCLLPLGALHGKHLVTIEGLNAKEGLSLIQQALVEEGATQCGFCTPGIVMALTGFLLNSSELSVDDAITAMEGNICRCTGYSAIRRAALRLVECLPELPAPGTERITAMVNISLLPPFFMEAAEQLAKIDPLPDLQNGVVVSGGTDLFVQQPDVLLSKRLKFVDDAAGHIYLKDEKIVIAASTTAEELMNSTLMQRYFTDWQDGFKLMASSMIRARATVAGNIVNASPIGDISIMLLAVGASLKLGSNGLVRELKLEDFYRGYKQLALQDGEIVEAIVVPLPDPGSKFSFEKVSKREHLDIASVNSALLINDDGAKISSVRMSAGGVGPIPTLLRKTAESLLGKPLDSASVSLAVDTALKEISPISDVRGSSDYKRVLLGRLITAHFIKLFPGVME
jgi:xanthine dehydrogenase small subunit